MKEATAESLIIGIGLRHRTHGDRSRRRDVFRGDASASGTLSRQPTRERQERCRVPSEQSGGIAEGGEISAVGVRRTAWLAGSHANGACNACGGKTVGHGETADVFQIDGPVRLSPD